jgi:hypothetical protein
MNHRGAFASGDLLLSYDVAVKHASSEAHSSTACVFSACLCLNASLMKMSQKNFRCQFPVETVPARQSIHYTVSRLKTAQSPLGKKPDRRQTVLVAEKLDKIGARLKTSPRKCLKCVAEETSVSRTSVQNCQNFERVRQMSFHGLRDEVYNTKPHPLKYAV